MAKLFKKIVKVVSRIRQRILNGFAQDRSYSVEFIRTPYEDFRIYMEKTSIAGELSKWSCGGIITATQVRKQAEESDSDFLRRKYCEEFNRGLSEKLESHPWRDDAWREVNDKLTHLVLASGDKIELDAETTSFEINGERFELNEGGGYICTSATLVGNIDYTIWDKPKYVWEWQDKCDKMDEEMKSKGYDIRN